MEFTKYLNAYRVQNNLKPVKINLRLTEATQIQSDYLASTVSVDEKGVAAFKIGHGHPEYPSPDDRVEVIDSILESQTLISENVAQSYFF